LNPRPRAYESPALPTELPRRFKSGRIVLRSINLLDNYPKNVVVHAKTGDDALDTTLHDKRTITYIFNDTYLQTWINSFLLDRKAQNMSKGTIIFYHKKLHLFIDYCNAQFITQIIEITPEIIRLYLLYLEEKGHNPGGVHAAFRTLRAFLYWWEDEYEPEGWNNPIRKVKPPKVSIEPLEPVNLRDIGMMLDTCSSDFHGARDEAILLALLDTGARALELCAMDFQDYNQVTGEIFIRQGKGRKPRIVYLGKKSRKVMRGYLKLRHDNSIALWVAQDGERISYWGLNEIIDRRARKAGVNKPSLHSFRRAFAINMLRAGVDVFSLQKLMGHADLQVLRRYLAQTTEDIAQAHRIGSPVDNNRL
jgi:integrase/recombinase XerD